MAFVDFEYSKTSVAIASFTCDGFKILGQSWNRNLGVRNLDMEIINQCCEYAKKKYDVDPLKSYKAKIKLLQGAEKARTVLSANSEAELNLECLIEYIDISMPIKKEEFEKYCQSRLLN